MGICGSYNLQAGSLGAQGFSGPTPFPGSSIGSLISPGASQHCTAGVSWGREQPGTYRDLRASQDWGQGAAWHPQGHQSHPGLGTGDRGQPGTHRDLRAIQGIGDQPGSSGWAFPAPSQWIKGLGAASCSGVSRPCRQEGLDGEELLQSRVLTSPRVFSWTMQCPP